MQDGFNHCWFNGLSLRLVQVCANLCWSYTVSMCFRKCSIGPGAAVNSTSSVCPARLSDIQWWHMTTCHQSSHRSCVGVTSRHPRSSGCQQSRIPTLCPRLQDPSGSWYLLRRWLSFQASLIWAYRWVSSCGNLFSTWLLHWNTIQMFRMSPSNLQPKATQQKCRWWTGSLKWNVGVGGASSCAQVCFDFWSVYIPTWSLNFSTEITQMQCFSCKHESWRNLQTFQTKDTNNAT